MVLSQQTRWARHDAGLQVEVDFGLSAREGRMKANSVDGNVGQELRPEAWAWHLLGLVNPLLVLVGNLQGGLWTGMALVLTFGMGPLLDVLLGRARQPRPPRSTGRPLEMLLFVHAGLHFVVLATLIYRAAHDGAAWTTWGAALSTGVSSGVSGIIVAHELGHTRPKSFSWWVARTQLLSVLYLHFTTEHNHTHHRHVATRSDPASARRGESLWWFVARTIPGQFWDAAQVQRSKGRTGWRNPVWQGGWLQCAMVVFLAVTAGPWVTLAVVLQAVFAIFLLEYINYIRHYGLSREVGERQTEYHSWQAEERWSRWTLLELTRHPAHHLKAAERFWHLQPYADSPSLPSGYYGCFWLALIPPLWRWVIHPRLSGSTVCRSDPREGVISE